MNNKFIVTENNVIVSDEKGNLKVTNNRNLNKRLKLENNYEILDKKFEELDKEVNDLNTALEYNQIEIKKIIKAIAITYGITILTFAAITEFSMISGIISIYLATIGGINILHEKRKSKKELERIKEMTEVASLNKRLVSEKRNEALSALIKLKSSENVFVEELTPNKEYTVDDNYEYTFKEAEYIEPEKPLSLARIKRVCREKLDKKRR